MSGKNGIHNEPVLNLRRVRKRREKGGNVFELLAPDLQVRPGEFIAVVGQSGCGKSTLLDMLGLVLVPNEVESFCLRLAGREHQVMNLNEGELAGLRKRYLGYVLQTGGLLPYLTVWQNILLPCRINGLSFDSKYLQGLVDRLGIGDQLHKKPQYLSGGQRQRVAIARALSHRPSLVLADEPTAAVDKYTAEEIRNEFKALTSSMGVALLMVTHDQALVADVADRTLGFQLTQLAPLHMCSELYEETSR